MDFQTGRGRAYKLLSLATILATLRLTLQAHHCQWATLFMLGHQGACCRQIEKGLELYDVKAHFSHAGIYGGHDVKVCAFGEASLSFYFTAHPSAPNDMERRAWNGRILSLRQYRACYGLRGHA